MRFSLCREPSTHHEEYPPKDPCDVVSLIPSLNALPYVA